ncbi:MAG: ATP-binding protein [Bdellovibrionaceae bacterium]|nr:ATP-binding protein [Pseudobdellovibrionaceae bacterium]
MIKIIKTIVKKYIKMFFYLWIVLLIVGSQISLKTYLSYNDHISSIKNQTFNTTTLFTARMVNIFDKMDILLGFLKMMIEREKIWSRESLEFYLKQIKGQTPEIQTIKIFDSKGNYFADTLEELSKKNVSDRSYFIEHKNSPSELMFISEPLISKSTGVKIIAFSKRINDSHNLFKGIIVITIEIAYLKQVFSEISLGKDGNITLLYQDEIFVARIPWIEDIIGKKIQSAWINDIEKNGQTTSFDAISPIDHIKRHYALNKINKSSYSLYTGLSYAEYLKEWKRSAITDFMFFLVLSFVSHILMIIYCLSLEKIEEQKINIFRASKMTTLGEMSSQLAHEINNPLTIIKSSIYSLNKLLINDKFEKDKITEALARIDKTTSRITKIISGLRAFSRAGDNDPFEKALLSKIFSDITELASHRLKMTLVKLSITCKEDLAIECKESQIEQVLLNLLNNSIDAVADLEEKWIRIEVIDKESNKIVILFSDSGKGIPSQHVDRIMEPFYTTKPVGKGTGLGLSISKGLLYNLQSSYTQFIIELPKIQPKQNLF